MSLQRDIINVPFEQGVATKHDPKQIPLGKWLTLENATFVNRKRVRKRPGYGRLAQPFSSIGTVGQAALSFKNELLVATRSRLWSRDVGASAWVDKDVLNLSYFTSAGVQSSQVVRNQFAQASQDSAYHAASGRYCHAWEDAQFGGGIKYLLIDAATGQVVQTPGAAIGGNNDIKPRVVAIGAYFVIFFVSGGRLKAVTITAADGTVSALASLDAAAGNNQINGASPNYDVVVSADATQLWCVYNNSTGGTGGITGFVALAATPATPVSLVTIVAEPGTAITVFCNSTTGGATGHAFIAYWNGTDLKFRDYAADLSASTNGTVETVANVVSITGILGCGAVGASNALVLFYGISAASTYNYLTRVSSISTDGLFTVETPSVLLRSVAPASRAFNCLGGASGSTFRAAYLVVAYQSPLQPTYFVVDRFGNVVAKLLYALGGGIPARTDGKGAAMLTCANPISGDTQWQFALLRKDLFTTQSGQVYTQLGIESIAFSFFDTKYSYARGEYANNLHIGGGYLQMYDGGLHCEHGFHLFPEPVSVPNPGGAFSCQYVVVYEWMDAQGQFHRSAASVAVTQAQANAIDGGHTVTVTIPTLRLTGKQAATAFSAGFDSTPVSCVVYRTTNNGTIFYRTSSVTAPTQNRPDLDTVTFTDSTTDAALVGNPLLYTTGGVIENIAPPPAAAIALHDNRVWALDATNRLQWWYSKPVVPGSPAEFTDAFVFNVDARGGDCVTGASLDDKFIFFKASAIFGTYGTGPNATGGGTAYPNAQVISSDVGCSNPRSVVQTPSGLIFQSAKGFYLLNRGLQLSYVGADVEAYNSQAVTSAQLMTTVHQVRFTLGNGTVLAYDYLAEQWSVLTNISAVDATIWQGTYVYIKSDATVMQETPGVFSDDGSFIAQKAVSGWISLAGVQGFQRAYKLFVLGEYASAHKLRVKIAYDFVNSFTQTDDFTLAADPAPYQLRVDLKQQKCTAIQVSIEDISTGTVGEALSLSAFALEVGLKGKGYKIPAARTLG